jgi:hypothetical protein
MKRVMAMEGRDWATSSDLSELGAAAMRRFEHVDARFDRMDIRLGQVETGMGQMKDEITHVGQRVEGLGTRVGGVETSVEGLRGRLDEGLRRLDERIDARHEADDVRFAMLADRVDNGFDRIQSDLRGQLLTTVTTQTRTLLFAMLGSFAVYGGLTLSVLR